MLTLLPHVLTFSVFKLFKRLLLVDVLIFFRAWLTGVYFKIPPIKEKKKRKENYLNGEAGNDSSRQKVVASLFLKSEENAQNSIVWLFHAQHCLPWPHAHLQPEVLCYLWITAVASLIIHQFHFSLPKVLWKAHKLLSLLSEFKIKPNIAGKKIRNNNR